MKKYGKVRFVNSTEIECFSKKKRRGNICFWLQRYYFIEHFPPYIQVCSNCDSCFFRELNWTESTTLGALIRSLDLNESQNKAVLNCAALKECYHKSTIKLIWGPPGTGKTKTLASFLFAMLKNNCRVVTCAPTNVAVMEVTKRLFKIALKSFEYGTYGLGNLVLYGNGKRMKIDDHVELFDVFLIFVLICLTSAFSEHLVGFIV